MAVTSGFYTSVGGDRKYTASDFTRLFSWLVTDGVFIIDKDSLEVTANDNMTVTVQKGVAFHSGCYINNSEELVIPIEDADGIMSRIDTVVARFDETARTGTIEVIKGDLSQEPQPTPPVRSNGINEYVLAKIRVNAGCIKVLQSDITDTRNDSVICGISTIRSDMSSSLEGKADKSVVDTLTTIVNEKADISSLENGTLKTDADRLQGFELSSNSPAETQILKLFKNICTPSDSTKIVFGKGTFSGVETYSIPLDFRCTAYLAIIREGYSNLIYFNTGSNTENVICTNGVSSRTNNYSYIAIRE